MITPTTITKEQLQLEKEFLINRIKNGSTTCSSILESIRICHENWERHNKWSSRHTSIERLSNLIKYEILHNILSERTKKNEMIQCQIKKLENELDSLKKIIKY